MILGNSFQTHEEIFFGHEPSEDDSVYFRFFREWLVHKDGGKG
jgi:hypothetical protein